LIATITLLQSATHLYADQNVGGAELIVNQVRGNLASGGVVRVTQGDNVFRDEAVRTDIDSTAKIMLLDSTSLSLGPSSSIKIDRFVYSGAGQHGAIAFNFVKGALRFATGNADKAAYIITTPTATLGVRGTILRISSTAAKTTVVLEEGAAIVCTRRATIKQCAELTQPNSEAVVTVTQVAVSDSSPGPAPATNGGGLGGRGSTAASAASNGGAAASSGGSTATGSSGGAATSSSGGAATSPSGGAATSPSGGLGNDGDCGEGRGNSGHGQGRGHGNDGDGGEGNGNSGHGHGQGHGHGNDGDGGEGNGNSGHGHGQGHGHGNDGDGGGGNGNSGHGHGHGH
jgi:FecR protein